MKHAFLGTASALVLMSAGALAAPADQPGHESPKPGSNSEAMSAVKDTTAGVVGKVSASLTSTTKGFVTAAATSDMYEVTAGKIALQGNLDPVALFSPAEKVRAAARAVLDRFGAEPGHVFNLGHGIQPGTPVESVTALVDEVRTYSRHLRAAKTA